MNLQGFLFWLKCRKRQQKAGCPTLFRMLAKTYSVSSIQSEGQSGKRSSSAILASANPGKTHNAP